MAKIEADVKNLPPDEQRVARDALVRPIVAVFRAQVDAMRKAAKPAVDLALSDDPAQTSDANSLRMAGYQ